jgi:hypothetical protein
MYVGWEGSIKGGSSMTKALVVANDINRAV